jgi:alanine-synthesizing transaminase
VNSFQRLERLPPYMFSVISDLKQQYLASGESVIDLGMGNPDQSAPDLVIDRLCEAAREAGTSRYSLSRGVMGLRQAICDWYQRRYAVELTPEIESIVTIGSKEGLAHLALAITGPGDSVIVPTPAYPIHTYGFVIAGANVHHVSLYSEPDFFTALERSIKTLSPKPKALVLSFPANPTAACVELSFFEKVIAIAKKHRIWIIHDLAYADIAFDGYQPPSILQVPGAKEICIESFSLSKSYNMPGWRVGFMVGNPVLVNALAKIKSYLDYGMYAPIQEAAITALNQGDACVQAIRDEYQRRRDVLCDGLMQYANWSVEKPKATMFVWAKIPTAFRHLGSLEFAKYLLKTAKVVVSPGIGFGESGDDYVRFSLIADTERLQQACEAIGQALQTTPTASSMSVSA